MTKEYKGHHLISELNTENLIPWDVLTYIEHNQQEWDRLNLTGKIEKL